MTQEHTTLLPCPFCGSDDIEAEYDTQLICNGCGASSCDEPTRAMAIESWNARAVLTTDTRSEVRVKALEWFSRQGWHGMLFAKSVFGDSLESHYKITEYGEWAAPCAPSYTGEVDIETAKAAAQAHYSKSIRSVVTVSRRTRKPK